MSRMNLISPRPGKDGKTFWHKVGSAFSRDAGGWSIVFDSLPLPDKEGRVTVLMVEPKPRDGDGPSSGGYQPNSGLPPAGGGGFKNDIDDEVPFKRRSAHQLECTDALSI